MVERRELNAVIYETDGPIARIILNRVDKANTKDAQLVEEVDACLHEADRDGAIKVVIIKANGNGFCGGHVARWGPDESPYPDFGDTFESLYKGTADLFLWPTLYLWEFPKPTISQIHGYCLGGGIYLGLLTDFCVASDDAYFQMPLARSLGEPGGHTMIEPWLLMNWHRTMDWLLLAPTLDAHQALEWGLLNKVVAREDLESTVEDMAQRIAQIPLTTLMAVKNNVKRAYELMGMRVHLQVSHILTNMVGAATDVQQRRAEMIKTNLKPRAFLEHSEIAQPETARPADEQ
ncbi:MAG TPA: enoyl-CoA hydratase-related protein [Mycobacteriales bacterium]|nr:enoyl-CoA hydratase-related protein [Mycobacteriales bacterium]